MADTNDHGHHGHAHDEDGKHEVSFTERNRAHWDKSAADYMSEKTQKNFDDLINKITAFILENISWIGVDFLDPASTFEKATEDPAESKQTVRFLDYACGPGTMTLALTGYASEYVGIDLSEKMIEQYNQRFSPQGEAETINAHAVVGNLLASEGSPAEFNESKYFDFDLVAVGLGFHHFENLEEVTRRLVERVKPGGVLMIVEFLPHQHNDLGTDTSRIVAHHGFTAERVNELFAGAGLIDIDQRVMKEQVLLRGTAWRTPFLARGRKPL